MKTQTLAQALREAGGELRMNGMEFSKSFVFAPEFAGFDGHFPGDPILPAVVQLMAGALALEEAGERLGDGGPGGQGGPDCRTWDVTGVSRAKFVRPVRPGESALVEGRAAMTETELTAKITLRVATEIAASYTLKAQPRGRHEQETVF